MATKTIGPKNSPADFASLTVNDVMERQVQYAHLETKGDVLASLLTQGFGAVPIVNGGRRLAGIVSEHDVLAAIDDRHQLGRITAADIMTGNPYSCGGRPPSARSSMSSAPAISSACPSSMPITHSLASLPGGICCAPTWPGNSRKRK